MSDGPDRDDLVKRFFTAPDESFFLFGPRGTGKTLLAQQLFPGAQFIDLLRPEELRRFSAHPEMLEELTAGTGHRDVVIDEVQRCPAILDVVHALIEQRSGFRFVLTGSSARKIRRADVDLLAGRALKRTLHPFMAAELADRFDLDRALRFGLVPLVAQADNPGEVISTYVDLYVHEEVKAEGLVRRLEDFSRFLEVIALSQACMLNISNIARECEVGRRAVENYISILEDLLLAVRLPVFSRRAARGLVAHPKLFLFDCGVFRALRPAGPLDSEAEIAGAALEGLVFQHLRAWNAYRGEPNRLYFWRTRSGSEVDFVVYGKDGLFAIEVKSGQVIHNQDLRSLRAFRKDYPEASAILLYRGPHRRRIADIACIPCQDFLRTLVPSENLPVST
ncbi:MAG: ATP-binding protein [Deltaproteobacteria bacterium]|nr:ATP-binding protein [Deltaproteobacteria bacterium]